MIIPDEDDDEPEDDEPPAAPELEVDVVAAEPVELAAAVALPDELVPAAADELVTCPELPAVPCDVPLESVAAELPTVPRLPDVEVAPAVEVAALEAALCEVPVETIPEELDPAGFDPPQPEASPAIIRVVLTLKDMTPPVKEHATPRARGSGSGVDRLLSTPGSGGDPGRRRKYRRCLDSAQRECHTHAPGRAL